MNKKLVALSISLAIMSALGTKSMGNEVFLNDLEIKIKETSNQTYIENKELHSQCMEIDWLSTSCQEYQKTILDSDKIITLEQRAKYEELKNRVRILERKIQTENLELELKLLKLQYENKQLEKTQELNSAFLEYKLNMVKTGKIKELIKLLENE